MDKGDSEPISVDPEHDRYLSRQVDAGRYRSRSDAVNEALRLLEDWDRFVDAHRDEIRAKIDEGLAAADRGELIDGDAVFERLDRLDREDDEREKPEKRA